jgi:cupin 2 domain-containing protein
MKLRPASLFMEIPEMLPNELCQTLLDKPTVRIERILSQGQRSPDDFWYDQDQDEWVVLLQGQARLGFRDGEPVDLRAGDYLLIAAHCQHRVEWTQPDAISIWLAIHVFDAAG